MNSRERHRVLLVGGPDVHLRLDLMDKLDTHFEVSAVGSSDSIEATFESRGYKYYRYFLSRRANVLVDLVGWLQLVFIYRKYKPDIVHTFATKPSMWGRLAAYVAGVPIIVGTLPGLGSLYAIESLATQMVRPFYQAIQRQACKLSALTIFQNPDDVEQFVNSQIVDQSKTQIVPGSGVDTTKFDPSAVTELEVANLKAELGIAEDKLVVTMISRLTKSKGVSDYVQAAADVKSQNPNVEFLLIGYADHSIDKLEPREYDELKQHVIWPGPRNDIPAILSASDIFVLPTAYREGIPRVLLEATAMRLPVVTTNMPGCKEVVQNEVTGFVIEPGNRGELITAIRRLLDDHELRKLFATRARERTLERFSLSVVAAQTIDIYRGLLQQNGPSETELSEYPGLLSSADH